MTPNWSDLLPEILNKITQNLNFYEDFINFLCVCTSWNSSITTTKTFIHTLPSQFPTLMLAESNTNEDDNDQNYRNFILLSNHNTVRKLQLPEAHRQKCVSTHGWLLTTGEQEFCAKLLHPISRTQIELPQLYMFEELHFDQDEWMYYCSSMRKVVFTSSNPLLIDPLFRVVIIWGRTIGFCRPGDASWTRINGSSEGQLFDITYHNMRKRVYVVAAMGSIYECDVFNDSNSSSLSHVSKFPGQVFGCSSLPWLYLLEWGYNSLLMVTRDRYYFKKHDDEYKRYGSYRTYKFQCFEFCLDDGKWTKVMSLGDKAVFLGFNSSFSINSGGGVRPDCIYFTDDLYDPFRDLPDDGGGDVGVYSMADGSIEAIFKSNCESIFRCSPPLWLESNTLPTLKKM
ncbi:putative F-box protein At5g55150 [Rutidosis leptorrhynchoides]|uniref:putative F-box protein At5g55150 n=1 Tax=Rutidosis leptorrhynchoides TaxID=125765 RepID=UPI003A99FBDB